ncbi:formylmethanofuran dehydrogenase subunit E (plasmid) [Ketogulonicigenium robustum]|uniref:Formylmethanofuran dehydrogenase subunit E n=1 Tax=Ketogulonicigenium robustum TaxID=92947 RepID=A0A1W6P3A3_9RHOB|nr:SAM-dependent methyltransferase [Ketogulonicigenium robustum]ARO15924.1 formylmethanofuran dehydrogenase subunit E [Ketogulonicigenium robustum]
MSYDPLQDDLRPHEEITTPPATFDAQLWFIGRIHSPFATRADCPKRGDPDNGPLFRIEVFAPWAPALAGVAGKDWLQILYWMHLSRRDAVRQNPSFGDQSIGTFAIRSPLRPNPIASSRVRLIGVEGPILTVRGLDCVDGTPLVDIKPKFGVLP